MNLLLDTHVFLCWDIDAEEAGNLQWKHTAPLDRLWVAQAMRLGFVLLTSDQSIRSFGGIAQLPA